MIATVIVVSCLALTTSALKKQRYVSRGPVDVLPGLQQDRQSGGNHVSSQFRCSQQSQSVNPIERFADRGWLSHSQMTDSSREPGRLRCKLRFQRRRVRRDYLGLLIWRGIIHPHEKTASAQGIRQFPLSVRGDHHNRPMLRDNGAQLRNRNLEIRENLQEKC